jgi:hypothetical protein
LKQPYTLCEQQNCVFAPLPAVFVAGLPAIFLAGLRLCEKYILASNKTASLREIK